MKLDKANKPYLTEKEVRAQVRHFLMMAVKCWWWNAQSALSYHGLADYEGIHNGRHFHLECKSGNWNGKLPKTQQSFKEMVEKEGEKYFAVSNFDKFIDEWNHWTGWNKTGG